MARTSFAPVCGVQMYSGMQKAGRLPSYHLLLAHDIIARPNSYHAVFSQLERPYTIILDNSVVELGNAMVDPHAIGEAARIVGANVIVLPDVYKDSEGTIASCLDAYKAWPEIINKYLEPGSWSFMMVPQGRTRAEFARCAEAFGGFKFPLIQWWGIPRNQVELTGSRLHALRTCVMVDPQRAIHMLGFSDDLVDDFQTIRFSNIYIRGIDSAVPLRAAVEGLQMSMGLEIGPRREGWLEHAMYTPEVQRNINITQSLINIGL